MKDILDKEKIKSQRRETDIMLLQQKYDKILNDYKKLPQEIEKILKLDYNMYSKKIYQKKSIFFIGRLIDYCIYDTGEVVPEYIKKYNKEGKDLVEQKIQDTSLKRIKFIKKNISTIIGDRVRHDPYLVAESAITLICDDLKYQDKENDPEYLMLNAKLESDKRINKLKKEKKKADKKAKKKGIDPKAKNKKGKQSKFSSKYSERIKSIKDS